MDNATSMATGKLDDHQLISQSQTQHVHTRVSPSSYSPKNESFLLIEYYRLFHSFTFFLYDTVEKREERLLAFYTCYQYGLQEATAAIPPVTVKDTTIDTFKFHIDMRGDYWYGNGSVQCLVFLSVETLCRFLQSGS